MWVRIVELYREGVALAPGEASAAVPIDGWLTKGMHGSTPVATFSRPSPWGTGVYSEIRLDVLTPLLRPDWQGMDDNSFTISGTQRRIDAAGVMHEELQVWWVRLTDSEPQGVRKAKPE